MANTYDTTPKNFESGAAQSITRYLDLAGLTTFWGKVKEYVDTQDSALWTAAKNKIDADDTAVRSYIESLIVNGVKVDSNKSADAEGTSLSVEINASHINVAYNGEGTPTGEQGHPILTTVTIQDAIDSIDTRLDDVQSELEEGVVSGLIVDATHGTYAEATKAWVDVTEVGTNNNGTDDVFQTGDIKIVVDDTAINEKFVAIDQEIADLEANAGVTNIKVVDVNEETATNKGLVEISITGTKAAAGEQAGNNDFHRGDITITLDESGLDEKIDGIDATVADEIADRKADSSLLAGDGAEIGKDGKLAWKTGDDAVTYQNISDISARLDEIDADLVTKIEEGSSVENYVTFEVTPSAAEGDKSISLTINDSSLADYIAANENNLTKLADTAIAETTNKALTVNGKSIITVTPGELDGDKVKTQVAVVGSSITLTTEDINRPGDGGKQLEEQLVEYDDKIAALASATHFRGVTKSAITDGGTETVKIDDKDLVPEEGDIVISMNSDGDEGKSREYIWSNGKWYELGDTTAEAARLTKVENWIDTNFITVADINGLNWTTDVPTFS